MQPTGRREEVFVARYGDRQRDFRQNYFRREHCERRRWKLHFLRRGRERAVAVLARIVGRCFRRRRCGPRGLDRRMAMATARVNRLRLRLRLRDFRRRLRAALMRAAPQNEVQQHTGRCQEGNDAVHADILAGTVRSTQGRRQTFGQL